MKFFLIGFISLITLFSQLARAEGNYFAGIEYTEFETKPYVFDLIVASAGYRLNDNIAFEARYGQGVSEEATDDGIFGIEASPGANFEISRLFGAYVKFNGRNDKSNLSPFLVLGYTDIEVELGQSSDSDSDFSYGVGMEYKFTNNIYVDLEFMRYYEVDDLEFDGVSISLNYLF